MVTFPLRHWILLACVVLFLSLLLLSILFIRFDGCSPAGRVDALSATSPAGDVNGDDAVDIADAIHVLQYLFAGGPPPVAAADAPSEAHQVLAHFSLVELPSADGQSYPTIRITGANLQIVNGLGATNGAPSEPDSVDPDVTLTNGVGNLIVGYNEWEPNYADRRGSHNIVVGSQLGYRRFGGIVSGRRSRTEGAYASVTGGRGWAVGDFSSVSGGDGIATGAFATIAGGLSGVAGGEGATVSGGDNNEAAGPQTSIVGGEGSVAFGYASCVTGGNGHVTHSALSVISAGETLETLEIHDWSACGIICP